MQEKIQAILKASLSVKEGLLADTGLQNELEAVVRRLTATFRTGGKVLFCGNGGSAADAQHIAAELSGRFYRDRAPLFAEALHVNTSFLTAVANDYNYEAVFARMTEAMGRKGDVLVGLSTSGNSPNVLKALQKAKELGMITVGMTGQSGGALTEWTDHLLAVPATDTPRVQEAHIVLGHIFCELVEAELFPEP